MFLPPGENYAVLRPEWVEWDSELPYNKCRTATFFNGSISIYQVSGQQSRGHHGSHVPRPDLGARLLVPPRAPLPRVCNVGRMPHSSLHTFAPPPPLPARSWAPPRWGA